LLLHVILAVDTETARHDAETVDAVTSVRVPRDSRWGTAALGWLALSCGLVIYGLVVVSGDRVSNRELLLAVALAGAGGAAVSAAGEVAAHLGERRFRSTWTTYYAIRPVLGAGLALLLYVSVRGGLLSSDVPPHYLNFYGILGLSFLAGIFARGAVQRLTEVFDALLAESPGIYNSLGGEKPPAVPELEPYDGYVTYETVSAPSGETAQLTLSLQRDRPAQTPSGGSGAQRLIVGDGQPVRKVAFTFTVYSHNFDSVDPRSARLDIEPFAETKEKRTFRFKRDETSLQPQPASKAETELVALVEISQYGQTVDVLRVGVESEEQAEAARANR
jgi:hypothetical protein